MFCKGCAAQEKTISILQEELRFERTRAYETQQTLLERIPHIAGTAVSVVPVGTLNADTLAEDLVRVYDPISGEHVDVPASLMEEFDEEDVDVLDINWGEEDSAGGEED
jgi:hypothetical protein